MWTPGISLPVRSPRQTPEEELAHLRRGVMPPAAVARAGARVQDHHSRAAALGTAFTRADAESERRQADALAADLGDRRVETIDGRITLDLFGRWVFESEGSDRDVRLDPLLSPCPLPGPWRAYVLPRSRVMLGAEPPPGAPNDLHLAAYRELLLERQALGLDDLAALRAGTSTRRTKRRLFNAVLYRSIFGLVLLGLFGAAGVWTSVEPVAPLLQIGTASVDLLLLGATPVLVWAVVFLVGALRRFARASEAPQVLAGPASLTTRSTAGKSVSVIHLGDREFSSAEHSLVSQVFELLHHDWPYRLFVVAGTLVGLEPLPVDPSRGA